MQAEKTRTNNIKLLIEKYGGPTKLGEALGKSTSQISQWANNSIATTTGKPTYISSRSCRVIEKALGLDDGWLDTPHEEQEKSQVLDDNIEPVNGPSNNVPLISWVRAGAWETPLDDRNKYDMVQCPIKQHSPKTFALIVRGISMYDISDPKSFEDGDTIFVDPTREAVSGSLVIAIHDGSYEATFKQLIIEDGKKYLHALNPNWQPNLQEITQDTYICGVVIAKTKTTTYV